ncbi:hypothetical protein CRM22_011118 [Opisthorchis felineus]|uniref:Trematode PH-like domain-containing protein n=1 Tax=Opisthorchis felineus TaxID=147828 RepID=A0A4S2KAM3_OPIFE|nr:hypothetical protein CRM22_011118 [Opisthorchis felineus]
MRKSHPSGRPIISKNSFSPADRQKRTKFTVIPLGSTVLRDSQPISEETILEVFQSNLQTQYSPARLEFFPTYLLISRKRDQESHPYTHFIHFYQCSETPDVFMWYMRDQFSGKRVYDAYMCQSEWEVKAIRDRLYQATSKSLRIFTDIPGYRRSRFSPASSEGTGLEGKYDENGLLEVHASYSDDSSASHSITSIECWDTPREFGSSRPKRMHRIRHKIFEVPNLNPIVVSPSFPGTGSNGSRSRRSSSRSRSRRTASNLKVSPNPEKAARTSKSNDRKQKRLPRLQVYAPDD